MSDKRVNQTIYGILPKPFRDWVDKQLPNWREDNNINIALYYSAWHAGLEHARKLIKEIANA